jgi:uncharacterized protein (TIGR03437 family)
VWVFDSLTRVAPTDPAGTQAQMTIYAGRGEYQSFQIGVQAPSGGLTNVNVTASALAGQGGATIPAVNLSLFREQYVPIARGQTSNGSADGNPCTECPLGPGTYADGLIPFVDPDTGLPATGPASLTAVPFALTAGQNQPIWVDVLVPRTATRGAYTGTLTITSDQGQSQVSLVLNVWNFTLPLQPSMNSAFLVWDEAHKPSTDEELMRNRLMPDTTVNAAEATTLRNDFGLGAYGIQWFSGADSGHCSTNLAPPTVSQAQSAAAPYQQLGLLVYDYSFDEIDACANLYPTIIQWAQNLHQAGVDQLITMAPVQALFNDGLGTGRSAVDIWTMEPDVYVRAQSRNPPMATAALAKGDQVWAYQTLIQDDYSPKWLIDFAPVGMRVMAGFLSQSLGFTGLLYWKVDGWLSGTGAASWTNVFFTESGNSYPGEGILVYPGEAVGMPGKVAPSMRLRQLRDGEQDYEYVQLLKSLGQGSYALQVASTVAASYMTWSQNPATLQAARIALGQVLDSLSGPPGITPGGIGPAFSSSSTIQPGEWVSIYGTNLASGTVTWNGNFPTSLDGTSVTINGKAAYLSFVSPGQINLQAPNDTATGTVPVVVTTANGSATSNVTLAQFAPSFLLLDTKHVAGIIVRSNGSGAYGGGAYDIIGPAGTSLGYATVPAQAGDNIELYGVGFGPTNPVEPAGQVFSAAAATTNPVELLINNVNVTPAFAGLSSAGLYQLNVTVPPGLGTGDVSLQATVGGAQTHSGVVISLR